MASTRTSTQSGNFGTGSTWVGGVAPVDGDGIVIAAGHTVHLDADYTGWTTGLAASTITGTLDVVQSAGTYGLKLAGTLSGAGKIVFNGGTGVDLPDNIIVNINSTYNGSLVTVTGACDIRCTEPAVPVATLKAAYNAGTSKIYVNETLDSVWANGRYLRVDNINQARQTEEFTIVNTGSDGGGQYITLSAGLAASKLINAKVCLTQRNIHFTGNMGSSQQAMNGVRNSTINAGFRAFTSALISCYSNTISGGTFSGNTSALISCYSNTISGGTYSGNTYALNSCYSNTISGGTYSGNTYARAFCFSNTISGGTYSGNTNALTFCYSNTISGGTYSGNTNALASCYSNTISGGTWTSNTYAFRRGSANFTKGVTFTGSTLWHECTPLYQIGWAYGEIINNGGVAGAFSARTAGGTTIHETTIKPADRVRSYKHTGEAVTTAAYPCFRQTELTVSPGRTLSVVFDGYKDWANGTNPLMQIIDKYADPLAVPGATPLATQSLDNTQNTWFRYTLTYANTGDTAVNVYLRTSMAEPTGNFYAEYTWEYTMTTEERAVLDAIATKAGYLPAATAGTAGGVALVGSEMDLLDAPNETAIAAFKTGLAGLVVSATGANTSDHADAEPDGGVVTTGTNTAGNSDSTWAAGTYWQIAPAAAPVNGYTLNVSQLFTLGVTKRANTVSIIAKESFSGPGAATAVHVWAYSYRLAAWEQLSFVGTGVNGWISGASDATYQYTLTTDHQEQSTGVVQLRYTTTATSTAQYLYLDRVLINCVLIGSGNPTVAEYAAGVKNIDITANLSEHTLGYSLMQTMNLRTNVATGDTATSFTITAGYAVADAYVGCAIQVEQESTETFCTRQIVGYTAARVVTLDAALPFTPIAGDGIYILAGGYSRVQGDASGRVEITGTLNKLDDLENLSQQEAADAACLALTEEPQTDSLAGALLVYVPAAVATAVLVTPANKLATDADGNVTASNMVAPPPTDYAKPGDPMTLTTAYDAAKTAASTGELTATQGAIQDDIAALPALIPPPDMEAAIETLEAAIDAAAQRVLNAGTGVLFTTEPVLDTETGLPVDDVEVRLTSDEAGNTTEARDFTDGTGTITVRLPAGGYFMWLVKSGYSFTGQPYSVEITE